VLVIVLHDSKNLQGDLVHHSFTLCSPSVNAVDVFVRKLRDKIDRQAPTHAFVHTRYGVGYKLEPLAK